MEEGGKRKEGIKHAELAERVPSDAYHHGYLDKCIKTTPSTPSQYRTDCAPQTRYTSISRTSFAIQRIPAVFEYTYIYIYILSMRRSSGEDVTRDTFPGVNFLCEEKLGSRGNRTRAGSTVSGAQACSGQTVYEIKPPQRA